MLKKNNVNAVWSTASEGLRELLNEDTYDRWFAGIVPLEINGTTFKLGISSDLFCDWLRNSYLDVIENAVSEAAGSPLRVTFEPGHEPVEPPPVKPVQPEKPQKAPIPVPRLNDPDRYTRSESVCFNRRFTFENFIIGENNRFAHAASQAVATTPGEAYNPLFIHGGTGLGKTHLLQAVAQFVFSNNPHAKIEYLSSEDFANRYIDALRDKALPKFRRHYRSIDLLLIDDVHFFTGKEQFQEEFFHTFNALYNGHKQIVMTSDKPPHEIGGLEKRLVSRFEWGLTTEIGMPDLETRIAILRKRQEENSIKVDDEILHFIASKVRSNIRRLEGALIRLVSYSSITKQPIDMGVTEFLLRPIMEEESVGQISIEKIQRTVAEYYDLRIADMTSKKRPASIAFPRQIAMYLCRRYTDLSSPAIAESFNRNHATVLHAVGAVEKKMKLNSNTRNAIGALERKLRDN